MPFVIVGLVVLASVAGAAILFQRAGTTGTPGAGPDLGATERKPDPPAAPVTGFQTTSPVEPPIVGMAIDPMADELQSRWMKSPAATTEPVAVNYPEDPFLGMAPASPADRLVGYAIEDLVQQSTATMFEDDIERPADLAFAPGAYNLGRVAPLLR